MATDVRSLLEQWGFAEFIGTFEEQGLELPELLSLTADELKTDLNMTRLGDRKRFINLCAAYTQSPQQVPASLCLVSSSPPLPQPSVALLTNTDPSSQTSQSPLPLPLSSPPPLSSSSPPALPQQQSASSLQTSSSEASHSTPLSSSSSPSSGPSPSPSLASSPSLPLSSLHSSPSTPVPSYAPTDPPVNANYSELLPIAREPAVYVFNPPQSPSPVLQDTSDPIYAPLPRADSPPRPSPASNTPSAAVFASLPPSPSPPVALTDPPFYAPLIRADEIPQGEYLPLSPSNSVYSPIDAGLSSSGNNSHAGYQIIPDQQPMPFAATPTRATSPPQAQAPSYPSFGDSSGYDQLPLTATIDSTDSAFRLSMNSNYAESTTTTTTTTTTATSPRKTSSPTTTVLKAKKQVVDEAIQNKTTIWIRYNGGTAPLIPRPIKPTGLEQTERGYKLMAMCLSENLPKTFIWSKVVDATDYNPTEVEEEASNEPVTSFYFDENTVKSATKVLAQISSSPAFNTLGLGKSVTSEDVIRVFARAMKKDLRVKRLVLALPEHLESASLQSAVLESKTLASLDTPTGYLNHEAATTLIEWVWRIPQLEKIRIRCSLSQTARQQLNEILDDRGIRSISNTVTNFHQHSPVSMSNPVPLSPSHPSWHSSSSTPTALTRTASASSSSSSTRRSVSQSPSHLSSSSPQPLPSSSSPLESGSGSGSGGAVLQCVYKPPDLKLQPVWIEDASVPLYPQLNVQARIPDKQEGHFYRVGGLKYVPSKQGGKSYYRSSGAYTALGPAWSPPPPTSASTPTPIPSSSPQPPQSPAPAPAPVDRIPGSPAPSASSSSSSSASSSSATLESGRIDLGSTNRSVREIPYTELTMEKKPAGRGAYGVVYRGTWRGATVAIKKLNPDGLLDGDHEKLLEEFRSEIWVMNQIGDHPNVIRLIGVCSVLPNLCLITPWVTHGSLEDLLLKPRDPPLNLPLKVLVRIARDIASGILHLHLDQIIHRDLALRNVLIGENYTVFVNDFGLSRFKEKDRGYAKTKSNFGPVKNMAPEAILSKKYSEKSDAFSFGILLWQLLTRRQPYETLDPLQLILELSTNKRLPKLELPSETHPSLVELYDQCIETEPDRRPSFNDISSTLAMLHVRLPN